MNRQTITTAIIIIAFAAIMGIAVMAYKKRHADPDKDLGDDEILSQIMDPENAESATAQSLTHQVNQSNTGGLVADSIEDVFFPYYQSEKDSGAQNKFPLKKGSRNAAVKQGQDWLNKYLFFKNTLTTDGIFGTATNSALKNLYKLLEARKKLLKSYGKKFDINVLLSCDNGTYSVTFTQWKNWEKAVKKMYSAAQGKKDVSFVNCLCNAALTTK